MIIFMGLALLLTGISGGCSGGEKATEPDYSAEDQYEALKPTIDGLIGNVLAIATSSLNEFDDFAPTLAPPPPGLGRAAIPALAQVDGDTVYQNGWYILSYSEQNNTENLTLIDSVRFTDRDGIAQPYPDEESTNTVRVIQHARIIFAYSGMTGEIGDYANYNFQGFQTAVVTVNGVGLSTLEFSLTDDRGTSGMDLTFAIDLEGLSLTNPSFVSESCPQSGTISMTINGTIMGFDDDGDPLTTTVDATVEVSILTNGNAIYTAKLGGKRYNETIYVCNGI